MDHFFNFRLKFEKSAHAFGVELRAGYLANFFEGCLGRTAFLVRMVRSIRGHGVEGVGDGHDPPVAGWRRL